MVTPRLRLLAVDAADAGDLAELRARAMRPSLEAVGRFDPQRVRARFLETFDPACTWRLVDGEGMRVGVIVVRARDDHLLLDHLYVDPDHQGRGHGAEALAQVQADAARRRLPVRLGALKDSPSNAFYRRHGFAPAGATEWDNHYVWHPPVR